MALTFLLAFVAGLALIGIVAWLVRRFKRNRLGANPVRGRVPRLAVIDAAAVDGKRRLVLVRRDNMEHLLMIGGPTDIVVETNIERAGAARDQLPQRPGSPGSPETPRATPPRNADAHPADDADHLEPQMPEPPPWQSRPPLGDELRRATTGAPERRGAQHPAELLRQGRRLEPRKPSRTEPTMPRPSRFGDAPKPARAPEGEQPPSSAAADPSRLEMAQRLERPISRSTVDPPTGAAPPVAPESPARDRGAPQSEEPASPPLDNIEDEMASLLGRSKST